MHAKITQMLWLVLSMINLLYIFYYYPGFQRLFHLTYFENGPLEPGYNSIGTFDMDKSGKILRHHWKERINGLLSNNAPQKK